MKVRVPPCPALSHRPKIPADVAYPPLLALVYHRAMVVCLRPTNTDGSLTPDMAWKYREGRRKRYAGGRVGGTVVVHFIKKNMWFLETAAALLDGEDVTPLERALEHRQRVGGSDAAGAQVDADAESDLHEVISQLRYARKLEYASM